MQKMNKPNNFKHVLYLLTWAMIKIKVENSLIASRVLE